MDWLNGSSTRKELVWGIKIPWGVACFLTVPARKDESDCPTITECWMRERLSPQFCRKQLVCPRISFPFDGFNYPVCVILLWFQLTHVLLQLYTNFLGFVQAKDKMPEFHEINAAWPEFKLKFSSIAIPKDPTPLRYLKVVSFPERTASEKVLKTTVADSPTFHHLSPKTFRPMQCHTFMKHN